MTNHSSMKVCFAAAAIVFLKGASGFVKNIPCASSPLRLLSNVNDVEVIKKEKKYIVVTGGVISGIGKGRQLLINFIQL